MARPKSTDEPLPLIEPVTETITYVPGPGGPASTMWGGITFQANVPQELTGHPDGNGRERLNYHMIETAKTSKGFVLGNAKRVKSPDALPTTAEQYRAYLVGWLGDPSIQHVDELIARFARDRELQAACEVGTDDYSYLSTLFMPRLHQLAKMDEMNELQVATAWARQGFNVLPW
jgi:hypothetical protein